MKQLASLATLALCILCGWYFTTTTADASAHRSSFDLTLQYRGPVDASYLREQLLPQANAIRHILGTLAGTDFPGEVNLDIALYADRESYLRYAETVTGRDMSNSGGFYSRKRNEAVTYVHSSSDKTLELAKHESTHVIAAQMLGTLPKWLNEGLADYFSMLSTAGSSQQVGEKPGWLEFARASVELGYPGDLGFLLSLDTDGWNNTYKNANYAVSWALVYFLMSSAEGQASVGALLRESVVSEDVVVDSTYVLDVSYPGGLVQLQRDFYHWLADKEARKPHYY